MSEIARDALERRAREMGWTQDTQLGLCLRFIDNRDDTEAFAEFLKAIAENENEISGPDLVELSISVPGCWKNLISTVLPEDLEGIKDAKHRGSADDPDPYYDDLRRVYSDPQAGFGAELELCSGQSNYWATVQVFETTTNNIVFQTQPYHEPIDKIKREVGGTEFVVDVFFDQ